MDIWSWFRRSSPAPELEAVAPVRTPAQAALLLELNGYLHDANIRAGTRVVRAGESCQTDEAYRWLYGSTPRRPILAESLAAHPNVRTYEVYDGQFIKNGKIDYTTAAGAYQATMTTWSDFLNAVGPMDFGPMSQDLFAVWCFRRHNAVRDFIAGDLVIAVQKIAGEWASMPSSTVGQPVITLNRAGVVFAQYGGTIRG